MHRRTFVHALGASLATGPWASRVIGSPRRLNRIGLELYSVRDAMGRDPDGTLAAVRAMGYTDVELLWSFGNFGRTTEQVRAALDHEGLRAPAGGPLARLPHRGGPHDAHRRHRTVRRVRAANRPGGRPPPARRRHHDHGWWTTVGSVRCTNTSYGTVPSMGVMWSASLWK